MRTIDWALGMLLVLSVGGCSRNEELNSTEKVANNSDDSTINESGFNAPLAEELGADGYGMKTYVMAFLKKGPNTDQDSAEIQRLQRAHLDNIGKLAEQRKLVVAGPFMDDGDTRGIYIFDVRTIEEAQALTETDPAIRAGRLKMELHLWYGSAALIKTAEIHKTISKSKI